MNMAATLLVAGAVGIILLAILVSQPVHDPLLSRHFALSSGPEAAPSAAANSTLAGGSNPVVYTAVGVAVACLAAAGLAFVIRRDDLL